eukprot:CAMPEP_0172726236 /NCGR_PEP_ID=MMETSP1074-20121228/90235_1 /TAXON_ID=2916 /ORGANISM="Ceratium fusus, Strain PA161109" /LENGTH=309 /DNA_ID=CAMNT_0013553199 /DNA_START=33 /DNA_END=964 /DNA_ORIENTATION=-
METAMLLRKTPLTKSACNFGLRIVVPQCLAAIAVVHYTHLRRKKLTTSKADAAAFLRRLALLGPCVVGPEHEPFRAARCECNLTGSFASLISCEDASDSTSCTGAGCFIECMGVGSSSTVTSAGCPLLNSLFSSDLRFEACLWMPKPCKPALARATCNLLTWSPTKASQAASRSSLAQIGKLFLTASSCPCAVLNCPRSTSASSASAERCRSATLSCDFSVLSADAAEALAAHSDWYAATFERKVSVSSAEEPEPSVMQRAPIENLPAAAEALVPPVLRLPVPVGHHPAQIALQQAAPAASEHPLQHSA